MGLVVVLLVFVMVLVFVLLLVLVLVSGVVWWCWLCGWEYGMNVLGRFILLLSCFHH